MNLDILLHISSYCKDSDRIKHMNIDAISTGEIIEKIHDLLPSYDTKRALFQSLVLMYQFLDTPAYDMFLYLKDILCMDYYCVGIQDEEHIYISILDPKSFFVQIQEKYPGINIDEVYSYIVIPVEDPEKFISDTYKIGELYRINDVVDRHHYCILKLSKLNR